MLEFDGFQMKFFTQYPGLGRHPSVISNKASNIAYVPLGKISSDCLSHSRLRFHYKG